MIVFAATSCKGAFYQVSAFDGLARRCLSSNNEKLLRLQAKAEGFLLSSVAADGEGCTSEGNPFQESTA